MDYGDFKQLLEDLGDFEKGSVEWQYAFEAAMQAYERIFMLEGILTNVRELLVREGYTTTALEIKILTGR